LNDITNIEVADDLFFTGLDEIDKKIDTSAIGKRDQIRSVDTRDSIFHNSAEKSAEKNSATEKDKNFFCTTSPFNAYALFLIIFLLGMIFQLILSKTFYSHKK